jgi:hypothetical protein
MSTPELPEIVRAYLHDEYSTPGPHIEAAATNFKHQQYTAGTLRCQQAEATLGTLLSVGVHFVAQTYRADSQTPHLALTAGIAEAAKKLYYYAELYVNHTCDRRTAELVARFDAEFWKALRAYGAAIGVGNESMWADVCEGLTKRPDESKRTT